MPLRDPNVVSVFGVAIEYKDIEIHMMTVMELCSLGSLQDYLFSSKNEDILTWARKTELCQRIAQGMAYLHGKEILHRDLKPGNVLMAADGTPKIADFGLSRARDEGTLMGDEADRAIEKMEMTANIGTPIYMAPELMSDANTVDYVGEPIDIYSFGILMYFVLTRERPYEKEVRKKRLNVWALIDLIKNGDRPQLQNDKLRGAPRKLVGLMQECWAAEPTDRPDSFKAVAAKLAEVLAENPDQDNGDRFEVHTCSAEQNTMTEVRAKKEAAAKVRGAAAAASGGAAGARTSGKDGCWEGATTNDMEDFKLKEHNPMQLQESKKTERRTTGQAQSGCRTGGAMKGVRESNRSQMSSVQEDEEYIDMGVATALEQQADISQFSVHNPMQRQSQLLPRQSHIDGRGSVAHL
jgi:serine/threonine protein kinase